MVQCSLVIHGSNHFQLSDYRLKGKTDGVTSTYHVSSPRMRFEAVYFFDSETVTTKELMWMQVQAG